MATSSPLAIGAHVEQTDPIAEAKARNVPLVQFFLGNPQSYKGPVLSYEAGAEALKADAEAAGVDLYVHAPYLSTSRPRTTASASRAASCSSSTSTRPPRSAPRD